MTELAHDDQWLACIDLLEAAIDHDDLLNPYLTKLLAAACDFERAETTYEALSARAATYLRAIVSRGQLDRWLASTFLPVDFEVFGMTENDDPALMQALADSTRRAFAFGWPEPELVAKERRCVRANGPLAVRAAYALVRLLDTFE